MGNRLILVLTGLIVLLLILAALAYWNILPVPRTTLFPTPTPTPQTVGVPNPIHFDHIVLIVMENKSYQQIIGNPQAPYINSLAQKYTSVANYYAVTHPSLPNYLALIGGSTFGIVTDCSNCFLNNPNLIDSLEKSNLSWKAYMESMPTPCFTESRSLYAQKHNPFIYFDDIRQNQTRCQQIVPFTQFTNDLSQSTPNFIWISPNLCNDMHDCSIKTGDNWLSQQIPPILNSPLFTTQNSLLALTWDEDNDFSGNHIPLILVSPKTKVSVDPNIRYTHYSLLHTIENNWDLGTLTINDKNAPLINFSLSKP